nr:hypothetical protein [uncultured Bacteroides sp.]
MIDINFLTPFFKEFLNKREEKRNNDKALYMEIRDKLLTQDGSIRFIREHNFRDPFNWKSLSQLNKFENEMKKKSFFFFDLEIEKIKLNLNEHIAHFNELICINTFVVINDIQSVPEEWEYKNNVHYNKVVNEMNQEADKISEIYDKFIIRGKKKFRV